MGILRILEANFNFPKALWSPGLCVCVRACVRVCMCVLTAEADEWNEGICWLLGLLILGLLTTLLLEITQTMYIYSRHIQVWLALKIDLFL